MKKNFLAVAACILLLTACTKSMVGDGPMRTETRQLAPFSSVVLNGDATIDIIQSAGTAQQVTVSGYDNLVRIYTTEIKGGELSLQFETGYNNIRNNNIHVTIETPDIHGVRINGSGEMEVRNFLPGTQLSAGINGSGYMNIKNSLFDLLSLSINGSGRISAAGATSKEAEVKITGSGDVAVTCQNKIKMVIVGSGNIDYYGDPVLTDVSVSGSGKIRKR